MTIHFDSIDASSFNLDRLAYDEWLAHEYLPAEDSLIDYEDDMLPADTGPRPKPMLAHPTFILDDEIRF